MNTSTQPKTYDNTPAHSVAFLGLGVMGYPMAAHLALAGHRVTVYNRTASKSEAFCAELAPTGRVNSAETPAAAAQGADLVFCCVGNDDDLRSVVLGEQGALAGMKPGAIFVDHTTASANVARELYAAARARGLSFVDAPVSGGQAGAQNGALTVMCGGDAAAFAAMKPVAMAFARAVTLMGDSGAFAGMKPGAIFVDHTTDSANVAREMDEAARACGVQFIDAPVSGGQAGAQNGLLTVMCGGDAAAFEVVKPVAMAYARAVTLMGPVGAGQLAKMVNQICIAGLVQGLSEAIAFGQRAGLDMNQALGVIGKGAAQSWQLDNRGPTMVEGKFDFGFAVDWMRKDLGLVLDEAKRNGARLPVTALVDQFYADVQDMGGGRWDTSSLIKRLK